MLDEGYALLRIRRFGVRIPTGAQITRPVLSTGLFCVRARVAGGPAAQLAVGTDQEHAHADDDEHRHGQEHEREDGGWPVVLDVLVGGHRDLLGERVRTTLLGAPARRQVRRTRRGWAGRPVPTNRRVHLDGAPVGSASCHPSTTPLVRGWPDRSSCHPPSACPVSTCG
jgi:hypothetical protein